MTVWELILHLRKMPQTAKVYSGGYEIVAVEEQDWDGETVVDLQDAILVNAYQTMDEEAAP